MQSRTPIIVALVVAIAAIFLTNMYIEQIRRESEPATSGVVVAAHDLAAGSVISKEDLAVGVRYTQTLPKFHVPASEITLYLGQQLVMPVTKDDYILSTYFGGGGPGERKLSQRIDAKLNQRALTIPVDNDQGLEGSIFPGDRIDLLITYQSAAAEVAPVRPGLPQPAPRLLQTATASLLENVYVITTGKFGTGEGMGRYRSLTLLLGADEAKLLVWAMNLGKLSVLLRNSKDLQPTDRAIVAGNAEDLKELGKIRLNVGEVVSKNQAATAGGQ